MNGTKEKIIESALKLFAEKGFKNTTTRDICQAAGVNIASVNYHFKGKTDLIETILEKTFEKRAKRLQKFLEPKTINNEKEWKEVIYNFIYNYLKEPNEEKKTHRLSRLFFRELANPSDLFSKLHHKYMTPIDQQLMVYIRMGLPENATEEEVALWVLTLISQCGFFKRKHHIIRNISNIDFTKPEKTKIIADHIAGIIFASLKYRY